MGCETSQVIEKSKKEEGRRIRRKGEKIIGKVSETLEVFENVQLKEEKVPSSDIKTIEHIISNHFYFSSFSEYDRIDIIEQMKVYGAAKDQYIFKQNDPGTLFFIIKKGKVSVEIKGHTIRTLKQQQCFGELSLIYTAPRSASVRAEAQSTFWCLHQSIVRIFTEDLMVKNYRIGKPFLEKVHLFKFLSKKQINLIAYNMNTLRYKSGQEIFKEGDDANAFYIITEGNVQITIPDKAPLTLKKGDCFGENSFKKHQIRKGNATAGTQVKLLSISRKDLLDALGEQNIQELIQFNILRWALKRSKIFSNINLQGIRKLAKGIEVKRYADNQIIFKEGQTVKHFLVSIEGKINDMTEGVLVNQNYLLEEVHARAKSPKYDEKLKKGGKGNVMMLSFKKVEQLLSINFSENNHNLFSCQKGKSVVFDLRKKCNTKYEELIKICSLGQGQFGKVFLVEDRQTKQRYALKCMSKHEILENEMERYVVNQKRILQSTAHPLIVQLFKTYKTQKYIFLLMEYIKGIDFFDVLKEIGLCQVWPSQFYLACFILCIEQLHSRNIVYRDLKPQNAVVDEDGYLHMIDLGTAKELSENKGFRTFTIIGTPHYMAPEMVEARGYGLQVDIWSLGIILYEMVCGKLPYGDELDDPYVIYKQIVKEKIQFPHYYNDHRGKTLIKRLLAISPGKREIEDFELIKSDPYFEGLNWEKIQTKKLKAPTLPKRKLTEELIEKRVPLAKYLDEISKRQKKQQKKRIKKRKVDNWDDQF